MHVFIDTNIFLSFYHYSNDELDALHDVFTDHEHGSATVYVTEQVMDEFVRNRDSKIKDALKKFNDSKINPQFPSFMKGYKEYDQIRDLAKKVEKLSKAILKKVNDHIEKQTLPADKLIASIFADFSITKITGKSFSAAHMRVLRGNPPGKNGSIGDALNWEILLEKVPKDNDIHIVSADGDFYSKLDEHRASDFLVKEWKAKKSKSVYVYHTLSEFTKEHFDGIAFSYDKDKEDLINCLSRAGNFSRTHDLISKLEKYQYFSAKEVKRILDAAIENDQFGWIVTDYDVSDFFNKHAVPRFSEISDDAHKAILQKVIDEQKERVSNA
jgi:predicted nucleic acid-binding protein